MFFQAVPFEVDTNRIFFKNGQDKLCVASVDDDISKIMVRGPH